MSDFQTIKGPFGDTAGLIGRTFAPTMQPRLARPNRTTTEPDRLQQAWRDVKNGGLEWRDVPVEIVEGLPPRR
jgi:hypothetical protein